LADPTLFLEAIETLQPGAGGRAIVELLDGRVQRCTALDWKAGRTHAPKWALELLADKIEARLQPPASTVRRLRQTKDRPGKKAGAINLARWLASR